MRALLALAAAGVFGLGLRPADPVWTVVIGGDSDGHLAPCGCTYPMSGGIRRRPEAIREHANNEHRIVLDTGSFVTSTGPQDRFKAEMLAEAAGQMRSIVALTPGEARMGRGEFEALRSLSSEAFVSASVQGVEGVPPFVEQGPFSITAIAKDPSTIAQPLGGTMVEFADALKAAARPGKTLIAMYSGDEEAARALAPRLKPGSLLIYRRGGSPAPNLETEAGVALASPGERGKFLTLVDLKGGEWVNYRSVELEPKYADDKLITRLYKEYLQRVDEAGLLDMVPRIESEAFAGSEKCLPCHANAAKAWEGSKHHHAYVTLEKEGHSRDPDCVRCHVTGLEAKGGFMSRHATPEFAFVGCESCHGPGLAHVKNPMVKIARSNTKNCESCHTRDNSPHFNPETYWKKIAH